MSGNSAFELVNERGWRRGLNNLLSNELAAWWGTSNWWVQTLIWVSIIGFMLVGVLFAVPVAERDPETGYIIYAIFAGMAPAVGMVIIMQGEIVGEKENGTAAWVLSKPVSRTAFILSKLISNAQGGFVTMVLFPGIVAYILFSIARGAMLPILPFLAALGVVFLSLLFFLTLTLMLGTLFNNRGPVIGLSLALLFLQQNLVGLLPVFRYIFPLTLTMPLKNNTDSIVFSLLSGQPATTYLPLLVIFVECVIFVLIGIRRFEQEEF